MTLVHQIDWLFGQFFSSMIHSQVQKWKKESEKNFVLDDQILFKNVYEFSSEL